MKIAGIASALLLLVAPVAAPAAPLVYNFSQGGYQGGATVSGSFAGEDLNGDGYLYSFMYNPGELTAFELTFSGNDDVAAFTLGLSNLGGFIFRLGGSVLGDDVGGVTGPLSEVLGANNAFLRFGAAGTINFQAACDGQVTCGAIEAIPGFARLASSTESIIVTPATAVPEAGSIGLLGLGALAIGARRRRRAVG